jgi:ribosomal protein S18 acetylase RimI-like enzyme
VIVRQASRADLPEIARLLLELDREGARVDPRHRFVVDPQVWRSTLDWMLFATHHPVPSGWVAEGAGCLIGVLVGQFQRGELGLGQPPSGKVQMLWVDEPHRRQGIGRALFEAFLGRLRSVGVTECDVVTLIRDDRAVAFWRSLGFEDQYVTLRRPTSAG